MPKHNTGIGGVANEIEADTFVIKYFARNKSIQFESQNTLQCYSCNEFARRLTKNRIRTKPHSSDARFDRKNVVHSKADTWEREPNWVHAYGLAFRGILQESNRNIKMYYFALWNYMKVQFDDSHNEIIMGKDTLTTKVL